MKARHEKAQAFLSSLAGNCPDLPFEPTLLPELFASTSASSMRSVTDIAALVERSQGLATRILRTANSAYYGMQTAVSSLSHAIRLLGVAEVRTIILQLGIASAIRQLRLPKTFPFTALWEHQILTAHIARLMVNAMPRPDGGGAFSGDELYAAGLLHDLGKTMIASHCPEDWQAISDIAANAHIPMYAAEEEYWGIDHAIVGARLLSFWGLPLKLTELVSWHHAPQQADTAHQAPTSLLAGANLLAAHLAALPAGERMTTLPEPVLTLLPDTLNQDVLHQDLDDGHVMDRVRHMAESSLEC